MGGNRNTYVPRGWEGSDHTGSQRGGPAHSGHSVTTGEMMKECRMVLAMGRF